MKRTLLIATIIGLFMVTTLDLQAHNRRKGLPRLVRAGIAIALLSQIHLHDQHSSNARYHNHQGRQIDREIRKNEKRIWKLEKRIDRLDRYRGNHREIRELEQEINWLERRNYDLRNQRY
jgi:predicted RNase H-like nuclease (RuvC/YqgF family)